MPLVAGVDCSTQSTKVLVVDLDDGRVVASGAASHDVEGDRGARETDPVAWEVSVATALDKTGMAAQVAAISVAAQQHGMVVLDGSGRPVRKAPLWNDTRDASDARALVAALGAPQVLPVAWDRYLPPRSPLPTGRGSAGPSPRSPLRPAKSCCPTIT